MFQWRWLEDLRASGALSADADQFNSVHERLIARLARSGQGWRHAAPDLHDRVSEDRGTIGYSRGLCRAGWPPRFAWSMCQDIGLHQEDGARPSSIALPRQCVSCSSSTRGSGCSRDGFGPPSPPPHHLRRARVEDGYQQQGHPALAWERHTGHTNLLPPTSRTTAQVRARQKLCPQAAARPRGRQP